MKDANMGPLSRKLALSPPGPLLWITDLKDIPSILPLAIYYAVSSNARLKLIHVQNTTRESLKIEVSSEIMMDPRVRVSHILEQAAAEIRAVGLECDWHLATSPMAVLLRDISEAWAPDRIICAKREGIFSEGLDPDVETILREANVPVFVFNPAYAPASFSKPARILFPTSLDRRAREIAAGVVRFARAHGADITMLHVIDADQGRNSWIERVRASASLRFREVTEELGGGQAETQIELGGIPETVVRIAQQQQFDLIFLSVFSGISFRSDIRPGSAYKILCNASCPVLVCKQNVEP
jgi:nucleotide-binding universal stress UspA family protein